MLKNSNCLQTLHNIEPPTSNLQHQTNCSSNSILFLIGGCVSNILLNIFVFVDCGFSIKSCATSWLCTASINGSVSTFFRALARAYGFFVNSAAPASAKYSLDLEIPKRRNKEMK